MKLAHAAKAAAQKRAPAKSKKPKPEVDKTSKEFVVKTFQQFLNRWPVTQQRAVRKILAEFLHSNG